MVDKFTQMMKGARLCDWAWIASFQRLKSQIFIYDHSTHSASNDHEIEWPIIWLLARYSRQHIMCPRRLPCMNVVLHDVRQVCERFRLKWVLSQKHDDVKVNYDSIKYKIKKPKGMSLSCPTCTCPALESWLAGLRNVMLRAALRARRSVKCDRSFSNMMPIFSHAKRILRRMNVVAVPTDKDGGFALVRRETLIAVHDDILKTDAYVEVSPFEHNIITILQSQSSLAQRSAKLEEDAGLAHALQRHARVDGSSVIANLKVTCKTHKNDGNVSHRNIHACPAYALSGIAQYLSVYLAAELRNFPHVVNSTNSLSIKKRSLLRRRNIPFIGLTLKTILCLALLMNFYSVLCLTSLILCSAACSGTCWLYFCMSSMSQARHFPDVFGESSEAQAWDLCTADLSAIWLCSTSPRGLLQRAGGSRYITASRGFGGSRTTAWSLEQTEEKPRSFYVSTRSVLPSSELTSKVSIRSLSGSLK